MAELVKFLDSKGISYKKEKDMPVHYNVGYDAPYKFWNRRNEVWVVAE